MILKLLVVFCGTNAFLDASLQTDLAQLDVSLNALSSKVKIGRPQPRPLPKPVQPTPPPLSETTTGETIAKQEKTSFLEEVRGGYSLKKPEAQTEEVVVAGIAPEEYNTWPQDVGILILGSNIFLKTRELNKTQAIPLGSIIRMPDWQKTELEVGKKSYEIWKMTKYKVPFIHIEKEDYQDFIKDTKMTIYGVPFIVQEGGKIVSQSKQSDVSIERYIDEQGRILGVEKIDASDVLNLVAKGAKQKFEEILDAAKAAAEKPEDEDWGLD